MTTTDIIALAEAHDPTPHVNGVGTVRSTHRWTTADGTSVKVVVSRTAARSRYDRDRTTAKAYVRVHRTGTVYAGPAIGVVPHEWDEYQPVTFTEFAEEVGA